MADKKSYGVITEQGFVAGTGLGFQEVSEEALNKKKDKKKEKLKDTEKNTITEKKSSK